jgi:hypothetical protein
MQKQKARITLAGARAVYLPKKNSPYAPRYQRAPSNQRLSALSGQK